MPKITARERVLATWTRIVVAAIERVAPEMTTDFATGYVEGILAGAAAAAPELKDVAAARSHQVDRVIAALRSSWSLTDDQPEDDDGPVLEVHGRRLFVERDPTPDDLDAVREAANA